MAPKRDGPFAQFNFLVDLGTGHTTGPDAGFQECSNLEAEAVAAGCGNEGDSCARDVSALNKPTQVTLKRGVIGSDELHAWLDEVRDGSESAGRTVRITSMGEDHASALRTWTLLRARIVKYVSGPFNAKGGSEVAMEELTLSHEGIEIEA